MPQLPKRLGLYLPDTFPGYAEASSDLFERPGASVL
jgi:hypothetical protein